MDRALDDGWDQIAFVVAIGFLLLGILIIAVIWFVISAIVAYARYQRYKAQAEAEFEQEAAALGLDIPTKEVLEAFWGAGIEVPAGAQRNMGQVIGATLFGMEEVEEW